MAKKTTELDDLGLNWFQDDPSEDADAQADLAAAAAQEEAERKAKAEAERKAREEAERKAREEAERHARAEAERKTREEAERKAREEAERKAREEAERKAREEAERRAREEAERKAREEAERKAREEAERKAREEAERRAREEAERKAREEAERRAREEAERKAREAALEDQWFDGDDGFASPTLVAPEEEPVPVVVMPIPQAPTAPSATVSLVPEIDADTSAPAVAQVAIPSEPSAPAEEDAEDEESDVVATADSFIDGAPDESMVKQRELEASHPSVAAALQERDDLRAAAQDAAEIPAPEAPAVAEAARQEATAPLAEVVVPPLVAFVPPPPVVPPPAPLPVVTEPEGSEAPMTAPAAASADPEAEQDDSEVIAAAALLLEREAAVAADLAHRTALLAEAGRVYATRLGNFEVAERLLGQAIQDGYSDSETLKIYGEVVAARGDYVLLGQVLERRARQNQGLYAAQALQDAALLERNVRQDGHAVTLLERALELAPDDFFTLRLLRDLHRRARSWDALCMVLSSMASLASGPRAARYLVEQGRVYEEHLQRGYEARAAYDLALDADPTYAPAFLSAERLALAAADYARLADLYETEARRFEGADAAFWWSRAASFAQRAGLGEERVAEAYSAALGAGAGAEIRHEHQFFLASAGRYAELSESLAAEAEELQGPRRAPVLIRLGHVHAQHLGNEDAAIAAWRAALEADPTADPALDALIRLLSDLGRDEDLLAVLDEHGVRVEDMALSVTLLYRAGELCEGPIGDLPAASARYRRILDSVPGYLPALEGLERVSHRLGDWRSLAALAEQRASLSEEPSVISLHLYRAGVVSELQLGDKAAARAFYQRSLEAGGRYAAALEPYARGLEADGDWARLADTMAAAAMTSEDGNEVVSYTYRAGRLYAEKVGEPEKAMAALRRCLELSPGFLPAMALLRGLCERAGRWHEAYDLSRQEAEAVENPTRRHWRMLGAAEIARHLPDLDPATVAQEILNEDPHHLGAIGLLEQRALETGDMAALVAVYRRRAASATDLGARARLLARVADLSRDAGDAVSAVHAITEVIEIESAGRPLVALARVAESLHYWEEAQRALRAAGESAHLMELARLQETYVADAAASTAAWGQVLEADPTNTEAAAGMERSLTRTGSREGLARAHAILADNLPDPSIKAVHALLAGHLFDADGERDEAIRYFKAAYQARPSRGKAFDALRRLASAAGDSATLDELYKSLPEPAPLEYALALEEAGASAASAAIYQSEIGTLLADDPLMLPLLVRLEELHANNEAWTSVYEILGQELATLRDPENRRAVELRRRRVLVEKLAETEAAWEFYRQLHEENPNDREVVEALARIATARGETDLALTYFEGLVRLAGSREEAARYQRRIAEVRRAQGDDEAARQAWLRALDFNPEDLDALAGLKDLAHGQGNWQGLVGVLAREATMLSGEERVARYREIARIWESEIKDRAVAVDAWRKVLEVAPDDADALDHLVSLTRELQDHAAFVEFARVQLGRLGGAGRADLAYEIGTVYLEHLYSEADAIQLLEAASVLGHLDAARALERVYAGRGDWERNVGAILRQAELSPDEAVALLGRAAQVRLEMLHDAEGVDAIYGQILARDPDNADALRFRGAHLFRKNDLGGAIAVWRRLETAELGRDLDDFDVRMEVSLYFYRFAEAERQLGELDDALRHYRKALELNPSHLPSLEAVGPLYMQSGQWEQAGEAYRAILQLTGGQGDMEKIASTYVSLGVVEQRLGDLEKARKRFSKALELRPNHVGALLGTASVLFARGEWNNLLNIYNNIIYHAQEPSRVIDAYLSKGYVLDAKMNLPDKAAQHYQKSLEYDPTQPVALLRLAEIALRRRDWVQAGALADRGLGLTLQDGYLRAGLLMVRAASRAAAGQGDAAQASYSAALDADASWRGLGERVPAIDALARALKERLQAGL